MQVHAALIPSYSPTIPAHQPIYRPFAPLLVSYNLAMMHVIYCESSPLLRGQHTFPAVGWTRLPAFSLTHLHVAGPAFAMSLHISTLILAKL